MLATAAVLVIFIGCVHSILGERYILCRLFKNTFLPKLFGSDDFTKKTLRFAWHLTTIAWWGFAGILFVLDKGESHAPLLLNCVSLTFLVSGLFAFAFTKGKHLSWVIFWSISVLTYIAAH